MRWIETYVTCDGLRYFAHAMVASVMVMDTAGPHRVGKQDATIMAISVNKNVCFAGAVDALLGYYEMVPLVTKYLWRKGYLRIAETCNLDEDCEIGCPAEIYESRGMTPYDVLVDVNALAWSAHTSGGTIVSMSGPSPSEHRLWYQLLFVPESGVW